MLRRAVLTCGVWLAMYAACSAPNASSLYQPYDPGAAAGGSGGSGGGQGLPAPLNPLSLGDASVSEGQGGVLNLAGASGGGPASPNPIVDAGPVDAGDAGADSAVAAVDCSTNREICDGIDNNCDGRIDEGNACAATCAGFARAGDGYMFCSDSVARDAAAERCQLNGMRLAWIETADENDFLVTRIAAANVPASTEPEILTYLGGSDSNSEGDWSWRGGGGIADGFQFWQGQAADNDGHAVDGAYANWAATEPNNTDGDENCAVLSVLGNNNRLPGNWDDRNCDSALPFVCEAP